MFTAQHSTQRVWAVVRVTLGWRMPVSTTNYKRGAVHPALLVDSYMYVGYAEVTCSPIGVACSPTCFVSF